MRSEGFMSLYKGFLPMIIKDAPRWASYFWANEFLKDHLGVTEAEKDGEDWNKINITKRLLCGGIAGQISWGISYPFDIVKTEIQCITDRKVSMSEAFIKGYQT